MTFIERRGNQTVIDADRFKSNSYLWRFNIVEWLREMWTYREMTQNLVVRDVKVRYKNSILGILWSLFNPLLMMLVFTLVFTVMRRGGGVPNFHVFVLCGLLPWQFFAASVIGATNSVLDNSSLVGKIYFPREILPLTKVLAELVNFCLALFVLFAMIFVFRIQLTSWALLLPLVILIQIIFTLGIGFILATLNVYYRDTQQIINVVMMAWFFLTPIVYPVSIMPRNYQLGEITIDIWRWAHILNPMTSLIATYRVILFYGAPPAFDFLLRTTITALAFLVIGLYVFRRYSWQFAEQI